MLHNFVLSQQFLVKCMTCTLLNIVQNMSLWIMSFHIWGWYIVLWLCSLITRLMHLYVHQKLAGWWPWNIVTSHIFSSEALVPRQLLKKWATIDTVPIPSHTVVINHLHANVQNSLSNIGKGHNPRTASTHFPYTYNKLQYKPNWQPWIIHGMWR